MFAVRLDEARRRRSASAVAIPTVRLTSTPAVRFCVDSSHSGEARGSRKGAFAGPIPALFDAIEVQTERDLILFASDGRTRGAILNFVISLARPAHNLAKELSRNK